MNALKRLFRQNYKIRFVIFRKKDKLEFIEEKKFYNEAGAFRYAAGLKAQAPGVRFFVMKEVLLK